MDHGHVTDIGKANVAHNTTGFPITSPWLSQGQPLSMLLSGYSMQEGAGRVPGGAFAQN